MMESREDWAGSASASTAEAMRCLTVCRKDRGAQSPTNITLPCASRRMRPSRGTAVSSGCSSRLTVGDRDVPIAATPPSWLLLRGVECAVWCSLLSSSQLCNTIQTREVSRTICANIPQPHTASVCYKLLITHPCEGVGPFGVCPADRGAGAPRTFGAVNLHVSARLLRTQYAQGSAPSHLTFRFLQRSHAATTLSTLRRFSGGSV